ncbi:MAG: phosphatidylglycerophosphatase A [Candidatus Lindowbacteria bacterium]|nr:phosphatidylglycerophosphatase A [Candidatus Lindowbacteria bacterium]
MTIATWFGSGYAPFASGTFGSLAALPLALLAASHFGVGIALGVALVFIGIPVASRVEAYLGGKDPKIVVIDEAAGMMFACAGIGLDPLTVFLSFLAFRFFDILKPPPCRAIEEMHGGMGIVLDDVVAGIYARIVVELFLRFL